MKKINYVTIDKAISKIKDKSSIVIGMAASEPQEFVKNIHKIYDKVTSLELINCLPMTQDAPYFSVKKYADKFSVLSWFYSPGLRKASKNGNISFIPNHLHLAAKKRFDYKKPDVFVGAASMPNKEGNISLSLSNVYEKKACELSDLIILEVNPNFPFSKGDLIINIKDVDLLVKTEYPAPIIPDIPLTEKDKIIGKLIADQIKDGSCIQLGIGGIPNAVAAALKGKKDLGIHTEMFTAGMIDLIEAGAVTNKKKQTHVGKSVAAFAFGSQKLYDYINNNDDVLILDGAYVNDPYEIGKNDNQVPINATIEISLDGQCASESIGVNQFSGTGGQADTAIGAQNSKNGKSFIALYSTAMVKNKETGEREEVSKIVPTLKKGAAVSLSRNDIDYVVTEYGMVSLRGTSISERAELLISISHPKFREELTKKAIELGMLNK